MHVTGTTIARTEVTKKTARTMTICQLLSMFVAPMKLPSTDSTKKNKDVKTENEYIYNGKFRDGEGLGIYEAEIKVPKGQADLFWMIGTDHNKPNEDDERKGLYSRDFAKSVGVDSPIWSSTPQHEFPASGTSKSSAMLVTNEKNICPELDFPDSFYLCRISSTPGSMPGSMPDGKFTKVSADTSDVPAFDGPGGWYMMWNAIEGIWILQNELEDDLPMYKNDRFDWRKGNWFDKQNVQLNSKSPFKITQADVCNLPQKVYVCDAEDDKFPAFEFNGEYKMMPVESNTNDIPMYVKEGTNLKISWHDHWRLRDTTATNLHLIEMFKLESGSLFDKTPNWRIPLLGIEDSSLRISREDCGKELPEEVFICGGGRRKIDGRFKKRLDIDTGVMYYAYDGGMSGVNPSLALWPYTDEETGESSWIINENFGDPSNAWYFTDGEKLEGQTWLGHSTAGSSHPKLFPSEFKDTLVRVERTPTCDVMLQRQRHVCIHDGLGIGSGLYTLTQKELYENSENGWTMERDRPSGVWWLTSPNGEAIFYSFRNSLQATSGDDWINANGVGDTPHVPITTQNNKCNFNMELPPTLTVCGASNKWNVDGRFVLEHDEMTLKQFYQYRGIRQDPSSLVIWFDQSTSNWIINRDFERNTVAWYKSTDLMRRSAHQTWFVSPFGSSHPDGKGWEESTITVTENGQCPGNIIKSLPENLFVCNSEDHVGSGSIVGHYTGQTEPGNPRRYVNVESGLDGIWWDNENGVWMLPLSDELFYYSFKLDIFQGGWFDQDGNPANQIQISNVNKVRCNLPENLFVCDSDEIFPRDGEYKMIVEEDWQGMPIYEMEGTTNQISWHDSVWFLKDKDVPVSNYKLPSGNLLDLSQWLVYHPGDDIWSQSNLNVNTKGCPNDCGSCCDGSCEYTNGAAKFEQYQTEFDELLSEKDLKEEVRKALSEKAERIFNLIATTTSCEFLLEAEEPLDGNMHPCKRANELTKRTKRLADIRLNACGGTKITKNHPRRLTNAQKRMDNLNFRFQRQMKCQLTQPTATPIATTTPTKADEVICDEGWTMFPDEKRCFWVTCNSGAIPYPTANEMCQANNSKLAEIKSEEQNLAVAKGNPIGGWMRKGGIWIGGNDYDKEGRWKFSDGSKMSYFNWAAEQPDDGNSDISQDCIWTNFMKRGEWDDILCDNKQSVYCVACSKDADVV